MDVNPIDFKNKKIAILGFGVEGLSSAKFLVKMGAKVTILDQKTERELDKNIFREAKKLPVRFVLGKNYVADLGRFAVIVRTPAIKRGIAELLSAEKQGSVVTSHTKLFFDLCPCPIIGVTGTKGKGTTAALIYEMLKEEGLPAGADAYLGGNIGKPPLDFLDKLIPQSIVVLELSSYQLEDLTKNPHIAVVLMVTREHLAPDRGGRHENYHEDVKDYVSAKRNILRFQTASDAAILNQDYSASRESGIHTQAKVYQVSTEGAVGEGCFVEDQKVKIKKQPFGFAQGEKAKIEIIEIKDILLPGRHNLENVCAAVMAALCAGVSKRSIVAVLKTFKGLEHRLQLVGEVRRVRYYDDSFSTTPETAIAAIQAFTQPEILILGGAHKGSDFSKLGRVLKDAKNIKAVIGIGVEWKRMKSQFPISNFQFPMIEGLKTMHEIVQKAAALAEPGDVVLLSPACSSFDMFKNYKERGEQFKREVGKLRRVDKTRRVWYT